MSGGVSTPPECFIMKHLLPAVLLSAFFFSAWAEVKHEFVCVDNQKNQLVYINQFKDDSWKVPLPPKSRDIFLIDDERVIVSHPDGAEIYRLSDGKSLNRFNGFKGVCSVSRTPNNTLLLGSPSGFIEMDDSGKTLRKIISKGTTGHLRLARMLENGNIVYCAGFEIFEIDTNGNVVWTHKSTGKTYLALKQDDTFLSTMGKEVQLVRVERDGTETVVGGGKENHPDVNMAWFSGFDTLPNGNVVVANWRGHGFKGESKHLFKFNADNKIVWSWDDPEVKGVTTVQMIR